MTATINASTSSGVVITPDNSGNILLQYNGVAAPAFSAYQNAGGQSIPSSSTKIVFDTEEFDTANCFNTSTYTFTPNVAGYYQIDFQISFDPLTANEVSCFLYKNGSEFKRGTRSQASGQALYLVCSTLVYANGTTDYFNVYAYQSSGSSKNLEAGLGARGNYFQGCLLRGA